MTGMVAQFLNSNSHFVFVLGIVVSFAICFFVWLFQFGRLSDNHSLFTGPQRIHLDPTPRIGGLGVVIAMLAQAMFLSDEAGQMVLLIVLGALPLFIAGFLEDLTNSISPSVRLLVSFIAGVGVCGFTGVWVTDVDILALNNILAISGVGIFFTVLAVASLANAFNIIDGLHGLSIGTAILMSATIGFIAMQSNDTTLLAVAACLVASLLGALILNFPFGKIFVGDGGAYFIGVIIAALAVLLPERNSVMSPFVSAIIVLYPFYELVRSFLRRLIDNGAATMQPDNKHLHSVFFILVRQRLRVRTCFQNSFASFCVLTLPLMNCLWAVKYFDDRDKLIIGILLFIVVYETLMRVIRKKLV